jgi:hypothetical protein
LSNFKIDSSSYVDAFCEEDCNFMKNYFLSLIVVALCLCSIYTQPSFGQGEFPGIGIGAKVSTLGVGVEGGIRVTSRSNARVGFNFYNYSKTSHSHGVAYDGDLDFRSLQFTYDQYLIGGLHVSPSLLAYNGTHADATANVPAGQSFTLGGTRYFSGAADPIAGTGTMNVRKVAPAVFIGIGNIVPRNGRRLGFNVEGGVVFQGTPTTKLSLGGTACLVNPTTGCLNAATDPTVQANVQNEQAKLNNDLEPFKYYPVVSVGISWQF